jgi:2-keto-4-pentenoate hydratase/2-oxohepta-3-ene-1,7-dioic acid hydratase in catechol pathway
MKLAQFKSRTNQPRVGILLKDRLLDISAAANRLHALGHEVQDWLIHVQSMLEVIEKGPEALRALEELIANTGSAITPPNSVTFSLDSVTFLPAVNARKILAIGRNYVDHAIEQGKKPPEAPLLFNKLPNSLSAHDSPIVLSLITEKVDYEAELAVVIGRRAKAVAEEDALGYVFGYAPINDVSARDLQFGDGQWTRGKGLDTFAPIGPFITTADEVGEVHDLKIEGRLNGQVMQSSNTSKMIFKVPYLISYLSAGITLEPGDVIATGTPEGVGIFREPPILLKPGDVFEVTIEKLGTLRNAVAAPAGD